jgi:hypothetical protein
MSPLIYMPDSKICILQNKSLINGTLGHLNRSIFKEVWLYLLYARLTSGISLYNSYWYGGKYYILIDWVWGNSKFVVKRIQTLTREYVAKLMRSHSHYKTLPTNDKLNLLQFLMEGDNHLLEGLELHDITEILFKVSWCDKQVKMTYHEQPSFEGIHKYLDVGGLLWIHLLILETILFHQYKTTRVCLILVSRSYCVQCSNSIFSIILHIDEFDVLKQ